MEASGRSTCILVVSMEGSVWSMHLPYSSHGDICGSEGAMASVAEKEGKHEEEEEEEGEDKEEEEGSIASDGYGYGYGLWLPETEDKQTHHHQNSSWKIINL